jgi:hypothetical protein
MNQEQRKFLTEQVQKTYNNQVSKLKEGIPEKPSLNNYLVAAFLDNTIKFNDIDILRSKMHETVLRFGISDRLIKERDSYNRRHNQGSEIVEINPEDLFIIPQNYISAVSEYEELKTKIEKQIDELESTQRTIIMKIQVGSSAAMDKLVMQIDSVGDLNILNAQLMLTAGQE